MIGRRRGLSVALATACVSALLACGGGGSGGAPVPTPIPPTSTLRPPTPTPEARVRVSRAFPAVAPTGASVVLEGAGFSDGGPVSVLFGGTPADRILVLNDRALSCIVPPGPPGALVAIDVSNTKGVFRLFDAFRYAGGGSPADLVVEVSGEPSVSFDHSIGSTTVVVDYLVRDHQGQLLEESDLDVRMFIDGEQLGAGGRFGESVLDRDSSELDLSVLVVLVLDASYSLQQFRPPQFSSMLQSAQKLIDTGTKIWRDRGGSFDWSIVWFDELIARPDPSLMRRFRIASIPEPEPGNFTKLYAAISNAIELSTDLLGRGIATGPRDRHVLVVFTDGLDNLSSFGNPEVRRQGILRNGDPYLRVGWRATSLDDVLGEIAMHPRYPENLTVHAIALGQSCGGAPAGGPCFDEAALADIAQVGFGQLVVSARGVSDLFELIQREFTTLQSSGAVVALPPGEYEFRLVAEQRRRRASGEISFRFRIHRGGAELLPF